MAMPSGNVVLSDKMQYPSASGAGAGVAEIYHPRQWFPDECDGFISWLRAEFAAANAIIDTFCHHLRTVGEPGEYDVVIGCIQQRRLSWNTVLHMQQYFSVAEVMIALQHVAWRKQVKYGDQVKPGAKEFKRSGVHGVGFRQGQRVDTHKESHNIALDSQNHDSEAVPGNIEKKELVVERGEEAKLSNEANETDDKVILDRDASTKYPLDGSMTSTKNSEGLPATKIEYSAAEVKDGNISATKGSSDLSLESNSHPKKSQDVMKIATVSPQTFSAMENYDGKSINVTEGMNLYDKFLGEPEVSKLISLANDLRAAGKRGQFQGPTFVLSKRPMKGHGREMIQLGVAIADAPPEDENAPGTSKDRKIEPIPGPLQGVIDSLVSMKVMQSKPDSCIIDIFNEGDHSQPHSWPPWFGRPVCTLFLSDCDVVFGRAIGVDLPGDYRGSLRLSLTPGSLLVFQGKSADLAKRAIPSIRKQRILVTFSKSLPRKATAGGDSQRLRSLAPQPPNWGPPPSRSPNHARPKQYAPIQTSGVLPAPPIRTQLSPPNGMPPPMFVPTAVAAPPIPPFVAAVPLPAGSPGWTAAPAPRHAPPPRLPNPGTGVFLPPPGSGSGSSQQQLPSPTAAPEGTCQSEMVNGNSNASVKGKPDGSGQRQESNGSPDGNGTGRVKEEQAEGTDTTSGVSNPVGGA